MDDGSDMSSITFRMPRKSADIMAQIAKLRHENISVIYREAVSKYLETVDIKTCKACGAIISRADKYCKECGSNLSDGESEVLRIFEELKQKFPKEYENALKKQI